MPPINGFKPNVYQIVHTLIIAAIVAGVTMYGTIRVLNSKMETVTREIERIVDKLDIVSMKQAGAIANAEAVHSAQQRDIDALKKK